MKSVASTANPSQKAFARQSVRARMTRQLAGKRAIGNPKASKFDGVIFLRSLKK